MTVEQRNVVDFVSMRSDGRAVLTVSDHLAWSADGDHPLALQSKLNDYLAFIESGQIYESYPDARGKEIEIQVVLEHSPPADGLRFLERAREAIVAAGFYLSWRTFDPDDVLSIAKALFSEHDFQAVMTILDSYGVEPHERERERVQRAVLRLSGGDEGKLRHFVQAAKRDYRDVLWWCESLDGPRADDSLLEALRNSWSWAFATPKRVLACNRFGNALVELIDGTVWRVCPEDLTAEKVAASAADAALLRENEEFQLDWSVGAWVKTAESTLGPLAEGQCYGFKVWPVLGGAYAAENMTIKSLTEWLAVSGAVGRQVKDLPDGSRTTLES